MPKPMNKTTNTKKKALTSGTALNSAFEIRVSRFVMDMYLKILNHILRENESRKMKTVVID